MRLVLILIKVLPCPRRAQPYRLALEEEDEGDLQHSTALSARVSSGRAGLERKKRLTGINRILKNASSEDAHSKPILSYMYVANIGKPPPTEEEFVSMNSLDRHEDGRLAYVPHEDDAGKCRRRVRAIRIDDIVQYAQNDDIDPQTKDSRSNNRRDPVHAAERAPSEEEERDRQHD